MKTATYAIKGLCPMLMHNDRLANPFDDVTRQIKTITSKRKRTDDDLMEIARLEHYGGLYLSADGAPVVPGYNLFAALLSGAKLRKLGAAMKRAAVIQEDEIALEYDGPKSADALWKDKRFVDMRTIKNGPTSGRVVRTRPIFKDWRLKFTVLYDEHALGREELDMIVADTGAMIGLSDYRPRFGRFTVEH